MPRPTLAACRVDDYHVIRFQACLGDYMTYDAMLRATFEHALTLHGLPYTDEDGDEFDHVVTAQQLGVYKPNPAAFVEAWRRMGAEPGDVIHVAQGWEYDIMPTYPLGMSRRVWINRSGLPGSEAFRPAGEGRSRLPGHGPIHG